MSKTSASPPPPPRVASAQSLSDMVAAAAGAGGRSGRRSPETASVYASSVSSSVWATAPETGDEEPMARPSNVEGLVDVVLATAAAKKDDGISGPVEAMEGKEVGSGTAVEAVLSLPQAPVMSLRKILEEADSSHSPHTVVCWYFFNPGHDDFDRMAEKACRPVTLLRPRKDYIVLPMGLTVVQDLWSWACKALGYELWQAIWVPTPPRASDVQAKEMFEMVHTALTTLPLEETSTGRPNIVLVPFTTPTYMVRKCEGSGISVFGDLAEHLPRKDILHPAPDVALGDANPLMDHLLHPRSGEPLPIRVPRGFTCSNKEELDAAYASMKKANLQVVLKPSWSSSGEGIITNFTPEAAAEYDWDVAKGPVAVEEFLDADRKSDGSLLLPVIHCLARAQFGEIVEQLIAGTTTYNGTVSPCRLEDVVKAKVQAATELLSETLDAQGFWGVDYLVVKGEPVLIDLNSGRPNGGHVPKVFVARFAPGRPFKFFKVNPTPSTATVARTYDNLMVHGMAFDRKARRGVTVLHLFPGRISSFLVIGKDDEDLAALLAKWSELEGSILV